MLDKQHQNSVDESQETPHKRRSGVKANQLPAYTRCKNYWLLRIDAAAQRYK